MVRTEIQEKEEENRYCLHNRRVLGDITLRVVLEAFYTSLIISIDTRHFSYFTVILVGITLQPRIENNTLNIDIIHVLIHDDGILEKPF